MAGINDGQPVDATNSNPAWIASNGDGFTVGKLDLQNVDPGISGPFVTNVQRNINSVGSFLGWVVNSVYNVLPTWATSNWGTGSDNIFQRVEALDTAFDSTTGHNHDGSPGSGGQISATVLANLNYYTAQFQVFSVLGATGASTDVSTQMSGQTPGGGTATLGVITTPPYNRVEIRDSNNGDQIEDPSGNKVYGRLTESSGVWTLTYYTFNANTESPYTIPTSYDTTNYFRQVFNLETVPTITADLGAMGSLDATEDIVDATATQPGKVSIVTQTFGGLKIFKDLMALVDTITNTFYLRLVSSSGTPLSTNRDLTIDVNDANRLLTFSGNLDVTGAASVSGTNTGDITFSAVGSTPNANAVTVVGQNVNLEPASASFPGVVSTTTQSFAGDKTFTGALIADAALDAHITTDAATNGSNATIPIPAKTFLRMTNGGLSSVAGLQADNEGRVIILSNVTGSAITVKNESGSATTAADRILTGTGTDMTLAIDANLFMIYDTVVSRWRVVGGSGGGGGSSSENNPYVASNYSLVDSFDGGNNLLVELKTQAGSDPSGGDIVNVSFHDLFAQDGSYDIVSQTSALNITAPNGATFGMVGPGPLYVYSLNASGTMDLILRGTTLDTRYLHDTDVIAASSTEPNVSYSNAAYTQVPTRFMGVMDFSLATPGVYDEIADVIALDNKDYPNDIIYARYQATGSQSVATSPASQRVDYNTKVTDTHNAITTGGSWVFTAPRKDTFMCKAGTLFDANATGFRQMDVYINGSYVETIDQRTTVVQAAAGCMTVGVGIYQLNAGDTIHFEVLQTSGTTLNFNSSGGYDYMEISSL